jgi:hypothetical protein
MAPIDPAAILMKMVTRVQITPAAVTTPSGQDDDHDDVYCLVYLLATPDVLVSESKAMLPTTIPTLAKYYFRYPLRVLLLCFIHCVH